MLEKVQSMERANRSSGNDPEIPHRDGVLLHLLSQGHEQRREKKVWSPTCIGGYNRYDEASLWNSFRCVCRAAFQKRMSQCESRKNEARIKKKYRRKDVVTWLQIAQGPGPQIAEGLGARIANGGSFGRSFLNTWSRLVQELQQNIWEQNGKG